MFVEVIVSLAIIFSFILNILYVDHPETISYTVGFVVSLLVMLPFMLAWRYWQRRTAERIAGDEEEDGLQLELMGGYSESARDSLERDAESDPEKGLGSRRTGGERAEVET